ncbi:GCN5 family acetyltransferase [Anaerosporomusa subterranea]|uniref:GCN5 family acetyltransferase n=1 Tax=Anaerosporomusa subterranea TaxID=1794912 RepID=A0A154BRW0_ANASB|nr:GNAT family N-acetyltransferase [Anaerosporomusa subterranea]KYZ76744.1 GCN5 family acetyltransferase [Anaerosporomusa subterranea]
MPTIVRIEGTDLKELAALSQELCGREANIACLKDTLEKIVHNPDYILIGARDDQHRLIGSVMGIICMDVVGDCRPFVVLENLIVSERARGLGIGKLLVSYIEERARERNCYYIMFASLAKRKEAHRFYESIGYAKGVVEGFKKYL